jgi:sulfoxide reductase heme-binding subunit YedZ
MLPLGATSTAAMVRRLGARRWLALHRSIYVIGLLAVSHFWWLVKKDITEPASFAAILAVLLVWRVGFAWVGSGSGRGDGQAAQSRPAARSET